MPEAILSISVDIGATEMRAGQVVIEALGEVDCPATWICADPITSPVFAAARQSLSSHEAGLLASARWFAEVPGRTPLVGEVLKHKLRAEQQGFIISTIASSVLPSKVALDLLAKQGITAIRFDGKSPADRSRRSTNSPGLTNLRFGLWQLQADAHLRSGGWSDMFAGARIRRAIDRACSAGSSIHLVVDLQSLSRGGAMRMLARIHRLLAHVDRRREEGTLIVTTIAGMIARLAAPRASRSAQSILRAA